MRVILHATDFSRASTAAFAHAIELARSNKAELLLTHVVPPVMRMVGEGYMSDEVYGEIERKNLAFGKKRLAALVARASKAGVRAKALLLEGVAAQGIGRAARSHRADLVVIGTHGRTGLAKLFLGSVAAHVLASAPCPVLTVRGRSSP
jgi:nucleotide-binding universal stress UspA family protein